MINPVTGTRNTNNFANTIVHFVLLCGYGSRRRTAAALLLLFSASICAIAQLPRLPRTHTPPASAKVESKTGGISGRVVDESGQPLVNVSVYLRPPTPEARGTYATTNRDGAFSFSDLTPGTYTVSAEMPSYISPPPSGPEVKSTGESVTLVLRKGGVISGTVTDSKGAPIVAIGIRIEMVIDERGIRSPAIIYEGMTDDRGVYRVYGLPTGTYIVSADGAADYSPTGVNAFAVDMPTYAPSSSREGADEIRVRAGEETSNVDIRYRGERGNTISGVVRGVRTGNRGFSAALTSLSEKGPRWNNHFRDDNGEFAFEGVPDGEYHLVATAFWTDRDRGKSESIVLNVRGADIGGVELTAVPVASISGKVVLKELKEPVPDCTDKRQRQFSEAGITPWKRVIEDAKKKPQFVWRVPASWSPDAQGNFSFPDLAAGEYYFGVRLPGQQWYLQSIYFAPPTPAGEPIDATRSWTTVKPGDQLSGLTFTLAQGGAFVRGQITLAEGQTLPDKSSVYLVPTEAAQAGDALRYFASPVNTAGNFWLHDVMPGLYWIMVQPGTDDTRTDVSKLRLPDAAELRSSLRHAAEQKKTEIELKPCQDITFKLPL